jgi:putative IMPACT (imprinted ancient) family translation regulator
LGQIRSHELTNVLIVVVRYFGGVKLGVGGLIGAYRAAAADALASATIIEEEVSEILEIGYEYSAVSEVMRLIKGNELKVLSQTQEEQATINAVLPLRIKMNVLNALEMLVAQGVSIHFRILD